MFGWPSSKSLNKVGALERYKCLLRSFLVQSWDEIASIQQLTAKHSQTEHNIGPVATAAATPTPTALKATALTLGLSSKSPWQQDGGHVGAYNLVLHL